MKNILDDVNLCYGCTACYSVCPVSAISMIKNDKGYFHPEINNVICIDCGRCKKVCPRLTLSKSENKFEAYAVKNKDDTIRSVSQSGGAFWPICEYVILNHGVVYGCILDDTYLATHIRVTTLRDAEKFHGSKYIQSDLGNTFNSIRKDLENGLLVLFVGTPCQVAGLKSYIGKRSSKLITVDLVCWEVASPLIWIEYIKQLELIYNGRCVQAKFRDKKYGWHSHFETMQIKKNKHIISIKDSTFKRIFGSKLSTRESCFSCQFKSMYRVGDFTIGDCWGIENVYKDFADSLGVSLFLINTDRVKEIAEYVLEKLEFRPLAHEAYLQPALHEQLLQPNAYDDFWDMYKNSGISGTLWKYGSLKYKIRYRLSRIKNEESRNNDI